MLGERSDQRGLWEADRLYLDHVGRHLLRSAGLAAWRALADCASCHYFPDGVVGNRPPTSLSPSSQPNAPNSRQTGQ